MEHPGIADSCVVGVTIQGEEYPRAYVVATTKDLKPEDVVKFMESKVSRHKRLTGGVKIVQEIAKNPSGKILRKIYREEAKKEAGDIEAKL